MPYSEAQKKATLKYRKESYARIKEGFAAFGLPVSAESALSSSITPEDVLSLTHADKKREAGRIKCILLRRIGEAFIDATVSDEELLSAIRAVM